MAKKDLRFMSSEIPEVRDGDEGEGKKIIGYAVKWDSLSEPIYGMFREQFKRGAFAKSLGKQAVYAAYQHKVEDTIGKTPKTLKVIEDDVGLRYEILPPKWFEPKLESIERGDVEGSSFIFQTEEGKEEWDRSGEMPIRTVKEADLYEISPVTNPAYPQSTANVRSKDDYRDIITEGDQEITAEEIAEFKDREADIRQIEIDLEDLLEQ